MSSSHKPFKKNFEAELWINNRKLPLNHFVQETLGNMLVGFLKNLKESDEASKTIELKIKKLSEQIDVDAHNYP